MWIIHFANHWSGIKICHDLKGQCHEIFCFWFFSWISFPPAPEYPIKTVSNFFENSRRYSQVKVHHRYQRHRWQICRRCQRHRWQFATGLVATGGKFATGINNTREHGGKICRRCRWYRWQFAAGVVDTGGAPLLANISANFWKNRIVSYSNLLARINTLAST